MIVGLSGNMSELLQGYLELSVLAVSKSLRHVPGHVVKLLVMGQ